MPNQSPISAGLLLYRRSPDGIEVFLAHPGGPFWAKKDDGAWTIPKGLPEPGEDLFVAAKREFEEETGIRPDGECRELGSIRQKAGKAVHAWACEGDGDADAISSNVVPIEWPRGSGRWIEIPEVDRCAWFDLATARVKINPAQSAFIDRLEALVLP